MKYRYPLCIGNDVGFGALKGVFNERRVSLMSLFGTPSMNTNKRSVLGQLPGTQVQIDGKQWVVGRRASLTSNPISPKTRIRDVAIERAALCALLGELTYPGLHEVILVTGLPVGWYSDYKEKDNLKGQTLQFSTDKGTYVFSVIEHEVLPQPVGTLRARMLNRDGRLSKDSRIFLKGLHVVLDIGTRTSDSVLIDDMAYDSIRSNGRPIGGNEVVESVGRELWATLGLQLRYRQMVEAVTNLTVIVEGKAHGIEEIVERKTREYLLPVVRDILLRCVGNGRGLSSFTVTGGYGGLVLSGVREEYPQAVLYDDPVFGNALGFERQAKLKRASMGC